MLCLYIIYSYIAKTHFGGFETLLSLRKGRIKLGVVSPTPQSVRFCKCECAKVPRKANSQVVNKFYRNLALINY